MDKKPNHLFYETSPYLLQHAYNPVDWFPWGNEAIEKAKQENKPVFLSIGYASCHWCHVMEKESFEDEGIAAYLNQHFIAVKVDREERPDIDAVYMDFAVATTGSGGWPLNVFLTPKKEPFFAGTYFPLHPKYGMPSFLQVLQMVKEQYAQHPLEIAVFIADTKKHFQALPVEQHQQITEDVLRKFDVVFEQQYDEEHGGMLGNPKFPITLSLLLCMFRKKQLDKMFHTLKEMGDGGICDQLGGGFFRYAVDEGWRVPHFEKMLYDNALLLRAYAWAFALSKDAYFKEKADEIFAFVQRELLSEKGFYSGIDADSEGEEGKHYAFTADEIRQVVQDELFFNYYCIEEQGEFEGKNVLRARESMHLDEEEKQRIAGGRKKLFAYREQRVKPAIDTKIITAWNSLMISGLVAYGRYCGNAATMELAQSIAGRLLQECWDGKRLLRVVGKQDLPGFLEDYSFFIHALLDVYETNFDEHLLKTAQQLTDVAITLFYAERFFNSSSEHDALFFRRYSAQDGVMPSGCSMMIAALLRLQGLLHRDDYQKLVEEELQLNLELMQQHSLHYQTLLMVVAGMLEGFYHVAVQGDEGYVRSVQRELLQMPVFALQLTREEGEENSILVCGEHKCQQCSNVEEVEKIVIKGFF